MIKSVIDKFFKPSRPSSEITFISKHDDINVNNSKTSSPKSSSSPSTTSIATFRSSTSKFEVENLSSVEEEQNNDNNNSTMEILFHKNFITIGTDISYLNLIQFIGMKEEDYFLLKEKNSVWEVVSDNDDVRTMISEFSSISRELRRIETKLKFPLVLTLVENTETEKMEKPDTSFTKENLSSFSKFTTACKSKFGIEDSTIDFFCTYDFNKSSVLVNDDDDIQVMIKKLVLLNKSERVVHLKTRTSPIRVIMLLLECDQKNIIELSRGGDALIYKVNTTSGDQVVRVLHTSTTKEALDEIRVASISSNFLIRFHNVVLKDNRVYFFMDYYENGTLLDKNQFSNKMILEISKQLLKGIKELHDRNKIHCDISPCNVFIKRLENEEIEIALGDFGRVTENTEETISFRGKRGYCSGSGNHSKFEDLYSFAATMFFVSTGEVPSQYNLSAKVNLLVKKEISLELIEFFKNIFENYIIQQLDVCTLLKQLEDIKIE